MKALLIVVALLAAYCAAVDITVCTSTDRSCGTGCTTYSGDAGSCIVIGTKSAMVTCSARTCANYNVYTASDCTGTSTTDQSLCNVCDDGSILECTATALTLKMSCANTTCASGCVTMGTFTLNTCSATGDNYAKPTGFSDCQSSTVEFYSTNDCSGTATQQAAWVANQCSTYNNQDITINCTGPATPSPVQPSTAATHTLVLSGDKWVSVLATDPVGLKATVRATLAETLAVDLWKVVIKRLASGSLIVDYYVTDTTLSSAQIDASVGSMSVTSIQTFYRAVTNSTDAIGVTSASTTTTTSSSLVQVTLVHALLALVLGCLLM